MRSTSSAWAIVAVATLAGAALRFTAIDDQSLWYDEVYSAHMLKWPLSVMLTVRDGHPPLFHIILLWLQPLLGEYSGRLLAAAAGTATIPLLALLGTRMFDRPTGVLSSVLLAISPLHVWYSREGRMYTLYVLFAVLSSLAVERIVRHGRLRAYVAWGISVLGGLLTHYGFTAVLIAQATFMAFVAAYGARRIRHLMPLALVLAFGAAALWPLARELTTGPIGNERGFSPMAVPYTIFTFVAGFGIGPTLTELHWSRALSVLRPYALEIAFAAVAVAALVIPVVRAMPFARRWSVYALLWLSVPPLMLATRSSVSGTAQNVRYVIGALPAFLLLVSHGLRHQSRTVVGAALALIVGVSALSLQRQYFDPRYQREDVRGAAAFLRQNLQPKDRIVVSAAEQRLTLRYYLASERRVEKLPLGRVRSREDARASLARWSGRTTWLVLTREWGEDPGHHLRNAVEEHLVARFPGVRVYRLAP